MFTLEVLHAHQQPEDLDRFRNCSGQNVLDAFDQFDWVAETDKANELKIISPTISAILNDDVFLWVSAVGEGDVVDFLSECYVPGIVRKGFSRRREEPGIIHHSKTYGMSKIDARRVLELFVNTKYDELGHYYRDA